MTRLRTPVQAPLAAPSPVGLIPSSPAVNDPAGTRWEAGFDYESESCFGAGRGDRCEPGTKSIVAGGDNPAWDPYFVWAGQKCSALGYRARDWEARARRILAACEGTQIEAELWTGEVAQDKELPNRFLASEDSDVLTDGATGLTDALACLEQYLAQTNCGQRGMIHATRQVITHWTALNLVRREGSLLLTIHNSIVVPGAGYDGSGPLGSPATEGHVWAYATGIVEVRRGDIEILGGPNKEGVNREDNTVEIRAERLAVASWDGCAHGAVEIAASLCGVGGLGS